MVDVPPGDFDMGARSDGDDKQWGYYHEDSSRELPAHTVTLDAYKIGKYEITNAQFAAALNWAQEKGYLKDDQGGRYFGGAMYVDEGDKRFVFNPNSSYSQIAYSGGKFSLKTRDGYSMEDHPVTAVTWYGSVAFCNWLSEALGLDPCYDLSTWKLIEPFPNGYRLPTEAEWERAAAWDPERPAAPVDLRHWTYAFMSDTLSGTNRANYHEGVNPLRLARTPRTSPVGYFDGVNGGTIDSPSPVGCYDMCGNVSEWVHDLYGGDYYATGGPPWKNPTGPTDVHNLRVFRGGSCQGYGVASKRSASRFRFTPDKVIRDLGFRVARTGHGVEVEGERPEPLEAPVKAESHGERPEPPAPVIAETHEPGVERTFAGVEFVWVPPGAFMMGSESGDFDEGPAHRVALSRGFWLGKYELTKGQWKSVMETEPWKGKSNVIDDKDSPAVYVSWEDAQKLIEKLNADAGGGFRLPTEAEWERACRAGSNTAYCFGDDPGKPSLLGTDDGENLAAYAWYSENIWGKYARVVGQKKPNAWGLHDMHGNVWEYCQDQYQKDYENDREVDPRGPKKGDGIVVRGGDYHRAAKGIQSVARNGIGAQSPGPGKGLRLAKYDEPMREPARGIPQKQADGRTPEPGRAADAERPESIREWPEQPSPGEAREKLDEMRVAPTGESLVKYAGGGQLDTVNLLLAAGVDIDSRAKVDPKARGMTALSFALNKNESEMVHFLIDRSADVNLADGNGITPLAAAAGKGDVEIFEALSAAGADPNTPDRKGRTPLLAAAENGDVRIVGALLAKGLDPNHADARGETPLFAAIRKSNTDAVKVLMADGADAHFANKDGRTPLYYAAVYKADAEIFEALLAEGTDPNSLDEGGRTILDIVVMVGRAEGVREILIAHGAIRPIRKPLFELWVAVFVLILLPLPYYRLRGLQHGYYKREGEDGVFYFEIRRDNGALRRKIQALHDVPPIRETASGKATLEESAGLTACGAREFHRHWRCGNRAYMLLHLHLRMCALALLFSAMVLVIGAEEQARSYGRFSPLFSSLKFLEYFFRDPMGWLIGAVIVAPLVAGGLELIALLILQFLKPPSRQRVTAIVIGAIAGVISIGCGLYYIALAMSGL
jgi:formylglycine-generating enzyme required for sulfatase activity/ankyrin repeat protein